MRLIGEVVEISIEDLVINQELKNANPQRTAFELSALEEQVRAEGKIRDPFLIWVHDEKNLIVDGFGRYDIVTRLNANEDFSPIVRAQFAEFDSIAEARYWIGINQEAKRNLTEEQKNFYYGQLLEELKDLNNLSSYLKAKGRGEVRNPNVAELVAEVHRISVRTVFNANQYYQGIVKIKKTNPQLGDAILNREVVDSQGKEILLSMDTVRKFSQVAGNKAIKKVEDITLLIKSAKQKDKNDKKDQGEKIRPATDQKLGQEQNHDPASLLSEYLKAPSRKGLDSLVEVLEDILKASSTRKAA